MSSSTLPSIIVLVGPTASGKSRIGVELALELGLEILNADSMQIYRRMDIGTAKHTPEERKGIPHHLLDIRNPDEAYSAADYSTDGRRVIAQRHSARKRILVVGGTGLYIKALLQGLFEDDSSRPEIRNRLRPELMEKPLADLRAQLEKVDPDAARRIHPNDRIRTVRALEVIYGTGQTLSERQAIHAFRDAPFQFLTIGLKMERRDLYHRIDQRVDRMRNAGLMEEVRTLLESYGPDPKPMKAIGYKECVAHLEDRLTAAACWQAVKTHTRQYAKRQLTWFRPDPAIRWFEPDDQAPILKTVREFLDSREPTP